MPKKEVYPQWTYFPRNTVPPAWVDGVLKVVAAVESTISTVHTRTRLSSDAVLKELRPGLEALSFQVETGRAATQRITRPVLYGPNGTRQVYYYLDGFHEELGIAVEVEAGQGRINNNDYRDIIRSALMLDVNYLVLAMPQKYRTGSGAKEIMSMDYRDCAQLVDAIYTSDRIKLPYELLLIGY